MADERDDEIAALKARLAALEGKAEAPQPPPPAPAAPVAQKKGGCGTALLIGAAVIGGLFALASLGGGGGPGVREASNGWKPPEGYTAYVTDRGVGVGFKWEDPKPGDCKYSRGSCFVMNVVVEKDCPSNLYASITLLGEGDDNIGWTNDTAHGVQVGETTKLVFESFEGGVKSARVAEISCY